MTGFSALKWFGTVTGIVGALLVAAHVPLSGYAYPLLVASSVSWGIAGAIMRVPSIWVLNAVWTVINCFGVWRWLIDP